MLPATVDKLNCCTPPVRNPEPRIRTVCRPPTTSGSGLNPVIVGPPVCALRTAHNTAGAPQTMTAFPTLVNRGKQRIDFPHLVPQFRRPLVIRIQTQHGFKTVARTHQIIPAVVGVEQPRVYFSEQHV